MARKKTHGKNTHGRRRLNPPRAPSDPPGGAYWTCLPIFHQPPNKCQDQTQNLPPALRFFCARIYQVSRRDRLNRIGTTPEILAGAALPLTIRISVGIGLRIRVPVDTARDART